MNKLIKELAEKSGGTHKQNLGVYQFYEGELEEFAESIVDQVLDTLCIEMDNCKVDLSNYPNWYKALIATEKHFGIES